MRSHLAGTDVVFEMKYRNAAGDLADPSTQSWKVYDNVGTLVDTFTQADTEVLPAAVGIWHFTYLAPVDARGVWTVRTDGLTDIVVADYIQVRFC